jgi:hypothetical protein
MPVLLNNRAPTPTAAKNAEVILCPQQFLEGARMLAKNHRSRPASRRTDSFYPGAGAARGLVADGEALPRVRRPLDLVDERNGVVGDADPALAVGGGEKLVGAEAKFSGPLPIDE